MFAFFYKLKNVCFVLEHELVTESSNYSVCKNLWTASVSKIIYACLIKHRRICMHLNGQLTVHM